MATKDGFSPGGLDLETPDLDLHPGALRDSCNFEVMVKGGYGRIKGYERVDGQTAPSLASFVVVQVTSFTNIPDVGATITQDVSGATGEVALVVDAGVLHYMVVTDVVGEFDATNVVQVQITSYVITEAGGPLVITEANSPFVVPYNETVGTATTTTVDLTDELSAIYTAAAADVYRALIEPVPGSGRVRGIFGVNGIVYAFRDDLNGNLVALYKTSAAGWVLVPFLNTIAFTGGSGTGAPNDGEVLSQGGVTATIRRIMLQSGEFADDDAAGEFVITDPSGGNFAAGAATTAGGVTVTLSGVSAEIRFLSGGHFKTKRGNFSGAAETKRIYGIDHVNKAWEFDPLTDTLSPIRTGQSVDAPIAIAIYQDRLFLGFGASLQFSGVGQPFRHDAIALAGEIACGDTINELQEMTSGTDSDVLIVYLRNELRPLYGSSTATYRLGRLPTGTGGRAFSAQHMTDALIFDDEAGIVPLQTTLRFGNFVSSSPSRNIARLIESEGASVIESSINRKKSQYRVFFEDGYGLYATFVDGQHVGTAPVLFPNPVFCCGYGEDADHDTWYFGSSDELGYVYQFDIGTSFDGEDINFYITLPWDFFRAPQTTKTLRGARMSIAGGTYATFEIGYRLDYGSTRTTQADFADYTSDFSGPAYWDEAEVTWDNFQWDGQTLTPSHIDLTGDFECVQLMMRGSANYIDAFTVSSVIYNVLGPRRVLRVG